MKLKEGMLCKVLKPKSYIHGYKVEDEVRIISRRGSRGFSCKRVSDGYEQIVHTPGLKPINNSIRRL